MRALVFVAVIAFALIPDSARATTARGPMRLLPHDPCGFRYAAWSGVQAVADYVNDAESGSVDSFHELERYNYVWARLFDTALDYHYKTGWRALKSKLNDAIYYVHQGLISTSLEQSNAFNSAHLAVDDLFSILGRVCPAQSKAKLWLGWFSDYGYQSHLTPFFKTGGKWYLLYMFACPPSAYAAQTSDAGNFIVRAVGGPSNGKVLANQLDAQGELSVGPLPPGKQALQIISSCAWHVRASPKKHI